MKLMFSISASDNCLSNMSQDVKKLFLRLFLENCQTDSNSAWQVYLGTMYIIELQRQCKCLRMPIVVEFHMEQPEIFKFLIDFETHSFDSFHTSTWNPRIFEKWEMEPADF